MALPRTPRSKWIDEGLDALAAGGPDAVRIESLARALGVSKGGFYGYFADRRALLDEMLDAWERSSVDEVIERVEAGGGDAGARLRRLSGLAGARRGEVLRIDLAVRDWARRDKRVARRLKRVDNRRMDYLRTLFRPLCRDEDDVEVRCLLFYSLWIGSHFIAADHPERTRSDVLRLALERLETPVADVWQTPTPQTLDEALERFPSGLSDPFA
jgi:AcrR family transcriptional regulator